MGIRDAGKRVCVVGNHQKSKILVTENAKYVFNIHTSDYHDN